MRVLEVAACPACGGQRLGEIELGDAVLRRCAECEAVSAPRYAHPADVYTDGYLCGETDFGLDVRDAEFQEYLAMAARRRLKHIERITGPRAKLLDVGCGSGEVLLQARLRGWDGQGVEPESTGAAMALERGLDVRVSTLEGSGLPEGSYDVVTAFHVLEHIPDTRGFLRTMARWARPGRHVAVEVPNFDSVMRTSYGQAWSGLRPLEHIVHFTPRSLHRAFCNAGLEPVAIRSPSHLGRPQTLEQALKDLARPHGRLKRLLKPLSRPVERHGKPLHVPTLPVWAALRAVERLHDRRGVGNVVIGIARVGTG